jgi:septum site-determining protein MinC
MNKAAVTPRDTACEIRFGQVGLAQVRLRTIDATAVHDELAARLATAPQMFERTAVCLDLSALEKEPETQEIRSILDAIRRAGMLPVGLAHGTSTVDTLARALDLPVLTQFRAQSRTAMDRSPSAAGAGAQERPMDRSPSAAGAGAQERPMDRSPSAAGAGAQERPMVPAEPKKPAAGEGAEFANPTLMHHQPVRSGQRVYARHRDLVVTSVVGAGAEVMADGCVHIYGALRGRAAAGARGEVTARIFCQEFSAELISIAGVFRVFETIPPELDGQPVQAWLDGDDLKVARVGG